jgi:imidazolonepropionase-like amidohydrolase
MVTVNPARALRQENALGQIRRGCRADLICIPCSGTGDVFEEIIAFKRPFDWILLNGKEERNTPRAAKLSK